MMKQSLFILLLLLLTLAANAQNKKFPPIHDLGKDSSLVKYVNLPKTAAAKKDVKFIQSQLDKAVVSSFDGESTIKSFIENWDLKKCKPTR